MERLGAIFIVLQKCLSRSWGDDCRFEMGRKRELLTIALFLYNTEVSRMKFILLKFALITSIKLIKVSTFFGPRHLFPFPL